MKSQVESAAAVNAVMHIETCHLSLLVSFYGGRRFKMYPTYKVD
jgi:hypothetical protein